MKDENSSCYNSEFVSVSEHMFMFSFVHELLYIKYLLYKQYDFGVELWPMDSDP